ncbi:MAG: DMT family transporter [Candidatus Hodarchaeales archaeon]
MQDNKLTEINVLDKTIVAELLLVLITLFWGSTFFLVKSSIVIIPVFAFLTVRFTLATLIVLPFILKMKKKFLSSRKDNLVKGCIVGLTLYASFAFQTIGLAYTSSTVAAFITGVNVILTPIFGYFLFQSKLTRMSLVGAFLAFTGVALLSGILETNPENLLGNTQFLGNVFVFICAIAIAFHILLTEKYTPSVDIWLFLFFQLALVAILSFISALIFGEVNIEYFIPFNWNITIWVTLFITVVFATVLAYLVQSYYQGKEIVSATRVALIFSLEPVFAALTGYIFLHEVLTIVGLIGAVSIFMAMIISHLNNKGVKT